MAITIAANLAKKLPIPGADFSSQQASITITAEVSDLNQVATEAQRLYAIAEQAVDAQLCQAAAPRSAQPSQSSTLPTSATSSSKPPQASQPYRGNGQRRQSSPCSPAQARYIRQLGERAPQALSKALADQGVDNIDALNTRSASIIIEHLVQATT